MKHLNLTVSTQNELETANPEFPISLIYQQIQSNYHEKDYSINQTQLSHKLGLSVKVLNYLRDTKVLEWKKVNSSVMYETNSIDRFTQIFKRSDYITVSECKSKLVKWGFYSEYEKGVYLNKLGFYLSVDSLIQPNLSLKNHSQKLLGG